MPGMSRGNLDTAVGVIRPASPRKVFVEGYPVLLPGDPVDPHGESPHDDAVMVGCSSKVFAGSLGVVRAGDAASCGDIATGSLKIIAN